MRKSKLIAFCGIDGCGKSTQIKLMKEFLEPKYKVMVARLDYFPLNKMGNNKVLDTILKFRSGFEITKYFSFLQLFDLNNYDYVLCDRHLLCYLSYAIAYDVKKIDLVRKALSFIKEPDLTLYFDVDVDRALMRIENRGEKEIDKSENAETLSKAKLGYAYLMESMDNVFKIDANGDALETFESVQKVFSKKM